MRRADTAWHRRAVLMVAASLGAALVVRAQEQDRFRSGVALLTIDATVLDEAGRPQAGLTADDFQVEIEGRRRSVSTLDYFTFESSSAPSSAREAGTGGRAEEPRTFVLLVDDRSFGPVEGRALTAAAERFIQTLPSSDRVGVVASSGRPSMAPTVDRSAVLKALGGVRGSYRSPKQDASAVIDRFGIVEARQFTFEELRAMDDNDRSTLATVASREVGPWCEADPGCISPLRMMASVAAREAENVVTRQMRAWQAVAQSVGRLPGVKVLVVLSGGTLSAYAPTAMTSFAREAAQRGILVHVLGTAPQTSGAELMAAAGSRGTSADIVSRDSRLLLDGLDDVARRAGGIFQPVIGTADRHFDRVLAASAARYRLGVELPPDIEPGADLNVRVAVRRPGLRVFAGTSFAAPGPPEVLTTESQVKLAIEQGRIFHGVPFVVESLIRRSPDASALELGLHFEVPAAASLPLDAAFAVFTDAGRVLQAGQARIERPDAEGGTRFFVAVPVPPGEYRLRAAVADATGSVGSLERTIAARLTRMGAFLAGQMSARWAGPGGDVSLLMSDQVPESAVRMDVGLELYRNTAIALPASARAQVRLLDDAGTVVSTGELTLDAGDTIWYAGLDLPLTAMRPGAYLVEVAVDADGERVGVATRGFVKTAPLVVSLPSRADVLERLRLDVAQSPRRIDVSRLLQPSVVERHVTGLDARATAAIRRGVLALQQSEAANALVAFEESLEHAPDAAVVMFYLGVANAMLGRDHDAVGAWSLALSDASAEVAWHLAQAETFVRIEDALEAVRTLEEARARWPEEGSILSRLGELYVATGRFEDARPLLESAARLVPDQERPLFLLTALAFADAVSDPASDQARQRFADWSSRYLDKTRDTQSPVSDWVRMVLSRQ